MKVERPLYEAIKRSPMSVHAAWHGARIPADLVPVPDRTAWQAARVVSQNPLHWNAPGAGREFLKFHRMMMRHYLWIRNQVPNLTSAFSPWAELPSELTKHLPGQYVDVCLCTIKDLVKNGSDDDLGGFIEATGRYNALGSNIHNIAHGLIALLEVDKARHHPALLTDAGMDDPSTAQHNEQFWNLHGWIDGLYASWQRNHDERVDQSPMDPAMGHDMGGGGGAGGDMGHDMGHDTGHGTGMGGDHMHAAAAPPSPASPPDVTGGHPVGTHQGDQRNQPGKKYDPPNNQGDTPRSAEKPILTPGLRSILRARFNPL